MPLTSQCIIDGCLARLECKVSGTPRPVVVWFRDSVRIEPAPEFLQFYDDDNLCSLVIKEVFPEDTGRYTVIAKNVAGTASCSAELVILEGKGYVVVVVVEEN